MREFPRITSVSNYGGVTGEARMLSQSKLVPCPNAEQD
jgi:hypothetical protein